MDNTPPRARRLKGWHLAKNNFLPFLKIPRVFANERTRQLYCDTVIPYMPMWKITIHVVTISINQ